MSRARRKMRVRASAAMRVHEGCGGLLFRMVVRVIDKRFVERVVLKRIARFNCSQRRRACA